MWSWRVSGAERERADAFLADVVATNVETLSPGNRGRRVQDRLQAAVGMHVAKRRLKKARTNGAVGLDHTGDPGRIALVGRKVGLPEQGRVVAAETPTQLLRRLGDVSGNKVRG